MGQARHKKTIERMAQIYTIVEERHPINVRGIAYGFLVLGLTPSMEKKYTNMFSDLTVQMREEGALPWEWIVDETRHVERALSWRDPTDFMESMAQLYRKNYWLQQPMQAQTQHSCHQPPSGPMRL